MMQHRGGRDERPRRSDGGEVKPSPDREAAPKATEKAPQKAPEKAAEKAGGSPDGETAEGDEK